VEANLAACKLAAQATVVAAPADRHLADLARTGVRYDLALVDPPYTFDDWPELLGALRARVVVCETAAELDPGPQWEVLRAKRYGGTVVTVVQSRGAIDERDERVEP
jgi:16S rRNA G966 N2-methylase RsmD